MAKENKKTIVEAIVKLIEKGKSTEFICSAICSKFHFTERTFYNHYKTANQLHKTRQEAIRKKVESDKELQQLEERKAGIMTAIERMEILTQIARGEIPLTKPMVVNQMLVHIDVVPDWMDRKAAIAELNKMDGEYAPTKVASTNTKGEDLPATLQVAIYNNAPPLAGDESEIDKAKA